MVQRVGPQLRGPGAKAPLFWAGVAGPEGPAPPHKCGGFHSYVATRELKTDGGSHNYIIAWAAGHTVPLQSELLMEVAGA